VIDVGSTRLKPVEKELTMRYLCCLPASPLSTTRFSPTKTHAMRQPEVEAHRYRGDSGKRHPDTGR
jgi:hypothetical protein